MPEPRRRLEVSLIALVVGNAVPLLGVLFLGWEVFPLILLYWLENVVVGVLNVAKIIMASPSQPLAWLGKVMLVPFFIFHYGMFTTVHGVFVFAMFGGDKLRNAFPSPAFVLQTVTQLNLGFAVWALVMSHLVSFVWNYVLSGEFRRVSPQILMAQPYARVVVLHLVILGGGAISMVMGSPLAALVGLVVLKTGIDIAAHRKERARLAAPAGAGDSIALEELP